MKKSIPYSLFLLTAFVVWLYAQSVLDFIAKEKEIESSSYQIIVNPEGMIYLLNKSTGTTWRWFRNQEDGEFTSEGWTPVNFRVQQFEMANAASATQTHEMFLELKTQKDYYDRKKKESDE
jgi:hypothetical protein